MGVYKLKDLQRKVAKKFTLRKCGICLDGNNVLYRILEDSCRSGENVEWEFGGQLENLRQVLKEWLANLQALEIARIVVFLDCGSEPDKIPDLRRRSAERLQNLGCTQLAQRRFRNPAAIAVFCQELQSAGAEVLFARGENDVCAALFAQKEGLVLITDDTDALIPWLGEGVHEAYEGIVAEDRENPDTGRRLCWNTGDCWVVSPRDIAEFLFGSPERTNWLPVFAAFAGNDATKHLIEQWVAHLESKEPDARAHPEKRLLAVAREVTAEEGQASRLLLRAFESGHVTLPPQGVQHLKAVLFKAVASYSNAAVPPVLSPLADSLGLGEACPDIIAAATFGEHVFAVFFEELALLSCWQALRALRPIIYRALSSVSVKEIFRRGDTLHDTPVSAGEHNPDIISESIQNRHPLRFVMGLLSKLLDTESLRPFDEGRVEKALETVVPEWRLVAFALLVVTLTNQGDASTAARVARAIARACCSDTRPPYVVKPLRTVAHFWTLYQSAVLHAQTVLSALERTHETQWLVGGGLPSCCFPNGSHVVYWYHQPEMATELPGVLPGVLETLLGVVHAAEIPVTPSCTADLVAMSRHCEAHQEVYAEIDTAARAFEKRWSGKSHTAFTLRPIQKRIIFEALRQPWAPTEASDLPADLPLICVMPTGAGKSICFQLPCLVENRRYAGANVEDEQGQTACERCKRPTVRVCYDCAPKFALKGSSPAEVSPVSFCQECFELIHCCPRMEQHCSRLAPAAVSGKGFTLVVSPLISLMQDQVLTLQDHCPGLKAYQITKDSSIEDRRKLEAALRQGLVDVLYVSPERLEMVSFIGLLLNNKPVRIVFDEFHTIDEYKGFRSAYRRIAHIPRLFPDARVMLFTATATEDVLRRVLNALGKSEGAVVRALTLNRPNHFYSVRPSPATLKESLNGIFDLIQSTVITRRVKALVYYTAVKNSTIDTQFDILKQKITRDMHFRLERYHGGDRSEGQNPGKQPTTNPARSGDRCYKCKKPGHWASACPTAGRTEERSNENWREYRRRVLTDFKNGAVDAVLCSTGFGLGIDRDDVGLVIHASMPASFTQYCQQVGRGGRDPRVRCDCVLFYDRNFSPRNHARNIAVEFVQRSLAIEIATSPNIYAAVRSAYNKDEAALRQIVNQMLLRHLEYCSEKNRKEWKDPLLVWFDPQRPPDKTNELITEFGFRELKSNLYEATETKPTVEETIPGTEATLKEAEAEFQSAVDELVAMVDFCEDGTGCRRARLLRHFGEQDLQHPARSCVGGCDTCQRERPQASKISRAANTEYEVSVFRANPGQEAAARPQAHNHLQDFGELLLPNYLVSAILLIGTDESKPAEFEVIPWEWRVSIVAAMQSPSEKFARLPLASAKVHAELFCALLSNLSEPSPKDATPYQISSFCATVYRSFRNAILPGAIDFVQSHLSGEWKQNSKRSPKNDSRRYLFRCVLTENGRIRLLPPKQDDVGRAIRMLHPEPHCPARYLLRVTVACPVLMKLWLDSHGGRVSLDISGRRFCGFFEATPSQQRQGKMWMVSEDVVIPGVSKELVERFGPCVALRARLGYFCNAFENLPESQLAPEKRIKQAAKYCSKISLMFSQTVPAGLIPLGHLKPMDDVVRAASPSRSYCWSDGTAVIGMNALERALHTAYKEQPDGYKPTLIQARILGLKGTWALTADTAKSEFIFYRPSQLKFTALEEPTLNGSAAVEICDYSRPIEGKLDLQKILILSVAWARCGKREEFEEVMLSEIRQKIDHAAKLREPGTATWKRCIKDLEKRVRALRGASQSKVHVAHKVQLKDHEEDEEEEEEEENEPGSSFDGSQSDLGTQQTDETLTGAAGCFSPEDLSHLLRALGLDTKAEPELCHELLADAQSGFSLMLASLMQSNCNDPWLKHLLVRNYQRAVENLLKGPRLRDSRTMFGCLDETGLLEEGEVFIQYTQFDKLGIRTLQVVDGRVLVTKNPCYHPGDVRILRARQVPELCHLYDVVVFSQKGTRPESDRISGSDLDGDMYWVCWDRRYLPPPGGCTSDAADYDSYSPPKPIPLSRPLTEAVLEEQMLWDAKTNIQKAMAQHFCTQLNQRHMLGTLSILHQKLADEYGADDKRCSEVLWSAIQVVLDAAKTSKPLVLSPETNALLQSPSPVGVGGIVSKLRYLLQENVSRASRDDIPPPTLLCDPEIAQPFICEGTTQYYDKEVHEAYQSFSRGLLETTDDSSFADESVSREKVRERKLARSAAFQDLSRRTVEILLDAVERRMRELGEDDEAIRCEERLHLASAAYRYVYSNPEHNTKWRGFSFVWLLYPLLTQLKWRAACRALEQKSTEEQ